MHVQVVAASATEALDALVAKYGEERVYGSSRMIDQFIWDWSPLFEMVSDRYGEPHVTTVANFRAGCTEIGWTVELDWRTDGETDHYVDQHGEVVLQSVRTG